MYQQRKKQNPNKNLCSDCTLKKRSPEMAFSLRNAGNIEYSDNTVKSHPLSKGDVSLYPATCADPVHTPHCKTEFEAHSFWICTVRDCSNTTFRLDFFYLLCIHLFLENTQWYIIISESGRFFSLAFPRDLFQSMLKWTSFYTYLSKGTLLNPLNILMASCQMLQNSTFATLDFAEFLKGKPAGVFET